jgi:hypothetical protein
VNRLRTYMSWKDVRKNVKETSGDGKGDVDDAIEEGAGLSLLLSIINEDMSYYQM